MNKKNLHLNLGLIPLKVQPVEAATRTMKWVTAPSTSSGSDGDDEGEGFETRERRCTREWVKAAGERWVYVLPKP